jgi:hypothetical protein
MVKSLPPASTTSACKKWPDQAAGVTGAVESPGSCGVDCEDCTESVDVCDTDCAAGDNARMGGGSSGTVRGLGPDTTTGPSGEADEAAVASAALLADVIGRAGSAAGDGGRAGGARAGEGVPLRRSPSAAPDCGRGGSAGGGAESTWALCERRCCMVGAAGRSTSRGDGHGVDGRELDVGSGGGGGAAKTNVALTADDGGGGTGGGAEADAPGLAGIAGGCAGRASTRGG